MARRKITKGPSLEVVEGLPDLTPSQLKFVEGLASGMTAADAYRQAYDASNSGNPTIWAQASALKNHNKVRLWLSALRAEGIIKAGVTLDSHLSELARLKDVAEQTGNIGAAVQAEQLRGRAAGHYVDKVQDVTRPDPMRTLEEIASINPDIARALARQYGLTLEGPDTTQ